MYSGIFLICSKVQCFTFRAIFGISPSRLYIFKELWNFVGTRRFELHGGFALGRTDGRELLSDVAKCVLREFERRFGVLANDAQLEYLAALTAPATWDPRNPLYLRHLTRCLSRIGRALGIALPAAGSGAGAALKGSSSSFDETLVSSTTLLRANANATCLNSRAGPSFSPPGAPESTLIAHRQLAEGGQHRSSSAADMASSLPRVLSGALTDSALTSGTEQLALNTSDTPDASFVVLKKQLSPPTVSGSSSRPSPSPARLGSLGVGVGARRSSTPPSVPVAPSPALSGAGGRRSSSVLSRARLSPPSSGPAASGGALTTRNWLELRPLNGAILTVQQVRALYCICSLLCARCWSTVHIMHTTVHT